MIRRLTAMLVFVLALATALGACGDDDPTAEIPVTPEATDVPDPRLRVELQARAHSTDQWAETVRARPGQLLRFRMIIRNDGEAARRARAQVELARGLGLVGISAYQRSTDTRSGGIPLEPGLARQGVVLETLPAGRTEIVFSLRVAPAADVGTRLGLGASVSAHARRAADTAAVLVARD